MVDAQGCGSVATQAVQAHELSVGRLVQGVLTKELVRCSDRGVIVTLLFQERDQTFRRLEKRLAPAISFRQNPLIVAIGQQFTAIQVHHLLQWPPHCGRILDPFRLLCPGQYLFNLQNIKGPGGIRASFLGGR
ncbi:MAG: hypothetical protein E6J21_02135 [Chloroflexota bacterium]|nr:MAG: hypothetical protein E6J21_02135 [Chloroflexota bacterium]